MNKEKIQIFNNKELNLQVRAVLNPDGSIAINAEDTAIGFGWIQTQVKRGKEYTSVRWERMNSFSTECGFPHKWGKDDYIPESLFYMLGFKAENERAVKYQQWLAIDVLPTIRKTGGYINNVDLMVNTYFSDIPDAQKTIVRGLLVNIEEKQKKIVSLTNENDLLMQKNLEWADRPLINSLVRAYASSVGDFAKAWNNYKKELLYKYGINLNSRITNYLNRTGKKTKPKTLDMIDDSELASAVSTAVALCKENNIDIEDLLNNKAD